MEQEKRKSETKKLRISGTVMCYALTMRRILPIYSNFLHQSLIVLLVVGLSGTFT
jgi:hypothetical protein